MEYTLCRAMENATNELIDYLEISFNNYLSTDDGFNRFWDSRDGSLSLSQILSQERIIATLSYLMLEEIIRRNGSFSIKGIDEDMVNDIVRKIPHQVVRDMDLKKLTKGAVKPFLEEYKIIKYLRYMPDIKELAHMELQ